MRAPNSLLRPRPACFASRPPVRTAAGASLAWTEGHLRFPFRSGPEDLSSAIRRLPARPLLPKTMSCCPVVEGRVRSLLVAAAAVFAALICLRLAAADSTAATCTVRLRPQAVVKGATPVLGDIANLSGDDEALLGQLAHTPLGSISDVRLLSRAEVLSLIRIAIPDSADVQIAGAEFTRISIATRTPEATEIAVILKTHLASVTPWKEEEIEIRSISPTRRG